MPRTSSASRTTKPVADILVGDVVKLHRTYVEVRQVRSLATNEEAADTISRIIRKINSNALDSILQTLVDKLQREVNELFARQDGYTHYLGGFPRDGHKYCRLDDRLDVKYGDK